MRVRNLNVLISKAADRLRRAGIDAGQAEAEIILCHLLDCQRLELYLESNQRLTETVIARFDEIIARRLTRYPLQYILGQAWFYGRPFAVDERVMVPCPETELLLEAVVRTARQMKRRPVRLLDIGTGSGVIAVSAALENREMEITATDLSPDALAVARHNAEKLAGDRPIRFIQSDLFAGLPPGETFDIIASNPPYIADGAYDGLPPEVKADPPLALLAGEKGMDVIEKILRQAPDYIRRPGALIFEIGYDQADIIFAIVAADRRYGRCSLIKDLADIDRIVLCKLE